MPYTGYQGFDYRNQKTGANMYVRKHNPAVLYDSVANKPERLANIKNLTLFQEDLKNDKLPQWMFITPNMTSDGHDTTVTVAGTWTANFLQPLLNNKNFSMCSPLASPKYLLTWSSEEHPRRSNL
jgi:acid phosphatase